MTGTRRGRLHGGGHRETVTEASGYQFTTGNRLLDRGKKTPGFLADILPNTWREPEASTRPWQQGRRAGARDDVGYGVLLPQLRQQILLIP